MTYEEYKEKYTNYEHYTAIRLRLVSYLKTKKIFPREQRPDLKNPRYSVFIYDMNDELIAALYDYFELGER